MYSNVIENTVVLHFVCTGGMIMSAWSEKRA